jgi:hypothetical protein
MGFKLLLIFFKPKQSLGVLFTLQSAISSTLLLKKLIKIAFCRDFVPAKFYLAAQLESHYEPTFIVCTCLLRIDIALWLLGHKTKAGRT